MLYRKPTVYIPPYNYCDRRCDGCTVDKSRCLLYQTEMDERLHREIDGREEPTAEEMVERIVADARQALRQVEEQVREMGLETLPPSPESGTRIPRKPCPDALVEEAARVAPAVADFLRRHGAAHPGEARILRHHHTLVGPKLGRAAMPAGDALEEADGILQAQVAHRALTSIEASLEAIRRRDPSLGGAMIDLRALLERLCGEIEQRWLSKPCDLLEPARDGAWWGPLRDITPTLRHFRR